MRFAVICLFAFLAIAYVSARPEEEKYTTKYDNIDIDQILNSDRLLGNYFNCLMDTGRCTPDGMELKKILPEAIQTGCSKCTDNHKEVAKKVIKYLSEKKPDMWKQLVDKYDPEGKYRVKFEEEAKSAGISL